MGIHFPEQPDPEISIKIKNYRRDDAHSGED